MIDRLLEMRQYRGIVVLQWQRFVPSSFLLHWSCESLGKAKGRAHGQC